MDNNRNDTLLYNLLDSPPFLMIMQARRSDIMETSPTVEKD